MKDKYRKINKKMKSFNVTHGIILYIFLFPPAFLIGMSLYGDIFLLYFFGGFAALILFSLAKVWYIVTEDNSKVRLFLYFIIFIPLYGYFLYFLFQKSSLYMVFIFLYPVLAVTLYYLEEKYKLQEHYRKTNIRLLNGHSRDNLLNHNNYYKNPKIEKNYNKVRNYTIIKNIFLLLPVYIIYSPIPLIYLLYILIKKRGTLDIGKTNTFYLGSIQPKCYYKEGSEIFFY